MRHIHTSIVSRHLATKGNNKILCTPPPHTSSSEERLPRLTRRTLAQLRTNKSPFLKSYLHKVNAKTHPSPLCPLCNIHTHDTHHLFNCIHIRTTLSPAGFVDRPRRSDCTAGQMDGEAGWWTTSGNIGLPPLARVMGVGRQQQQEISTHITPELTKGAPVYVDDILGIGYSKTVEKVIRNSRRLEEDKKFRFSRKKNQNIWL